MIPSVPKNAVDGFDEPPRVLFGVVAEQIDPLEVPEIVSYANIAIRNRAVIESDRDKKWIRRAPHA
jgi:hypothetical protein